MYFENAHSSYEQAQSLCKSKTQSPHQPKNWIYSLVSLSLFPSKRYNLCFDFLYQFLANQLLVSSRFDRVSSDKSSQLVFYLGSLLFQIHVSRYQWVLAYKLQNSQWKGKILYVHSMCLVWCLIRSGTLLQFHSTFRPS